MKELRQRVAVYLGLRRPPAPHYVSRRRQIVAVVFAVDVAVLALALFLLLGNGGHGLIVFTAIVGGIGFLLGGVAMLAGLRRR